jgi:hypothetical protein
VADVVISWSTKNPTRAEAESLRDMMQGSVDKLQETLIEFKETIICC